jgi:hypothetical protein
MSMLLKCYYKEKFQSKLGIELEFREELRLQPVRDPECWIVLCWTRDGETPWKDAFGSKKTNQEIYDHYIWILEQDPKNNEVEHYYEMHDQVAIFNGADPADFTPKKSYTRLEMLKQEFYEPFFQKYGIDNCQFCAL